MKLLIVLGLLGTSSFSLDWAFSRVYRRGYRRGYLEASETIGQHGRPTTD